MRAGAQGVAPTGDRIELFGRMVFNAVCGNDDDHPRNHAVVYRHSERRWRLAPAFDVVPDPVGTPERLAMQTSLGRLDISRESMLADALRFGFGSSDEAGRHLDRLLSRIEAAFEAGTQSLTPDWRQVLHRRMADVLSKLR